MAVTENNEINEVLIKNENIDENLNFIDFNTNLENSLFKKKIDKKLNFKTLSSVFDIKTLNILQNLVNKKLLADFSVRPISSGKESLVFTGLLNRNVENKYKEKDQDKIKGFDFEDNLNKEYIPVVIKIFKTSTMLFKNRIKYFFNESRFSFNNSNSRKLITLWNEKEVRNLKRIKKKGILCPTVLYSKRNILIMSIIGEASNKEDKEKESTEKIKTLNLTKNHIYIKNMQKTLLKDLQSKPMTEIVLAKRLKDCENIDLKMYEKTIGILKDLYEKANLIHADFSEYNLLFYKENVYVIDVGQSIDKSSNNALSFLIKDIININAFFKSKDIQIKDTNFLFKEITKLEIPSYIKEITEGVYIPRELDGISNIEDIEIFINNNNNQDIDINNNNNQDIDINNQDIDIDINNNKDINNNQDINNKDIDIDINNNKDINNINNNQDIDINNKDINNKDININNFISTKENCFIRKINNIKIPNNKERKKIVKDLNRENRKRKSERKKEFKKK